MRILLIAFISLSISSSLWAQSFHDEVQETFNFFPHKLSDVEQQKLFPMLDKFFNKVIANKDKYIQPLRDELKRNDNNPYFYYDGGVLLLEISKEPADFQIVADALTKIDLRDVPSKMYLQHLLRLSGNEDVIDGTLHILSFPNFQVLIPQHALLLNQAECFKLILPRYNSDLYLTKLQEVFSNTKTDSIRASIIESFFYARNCKADEFLKQVFESKTETEEIKKMANKMLDPPPFKRSNNLEEYDKIRLKIKETRIRISDEAILEMMQLSLELTKYYSCSD
ncbi:MAG: hypothetical protein HRT71_18920 [Flavobacteriales bacterium]|nr:hypothetical protein [Flavobacteriales bacterium]